MQIYKFKKYYFLLLFFKLCILVDAQESNYIYEPVESEVTTDNAIISIIQDDEGLLWFGTANGLYKYDGHSYLHLKNIENDTTSLPTNAVRMVAKNSKGEIWVFGHKFLSLINRSNHKFSHYWDNRIFEDYFPRSICIDNKDNIWFLMLGKISKFNTINRKWSIYSYSGTGIDSKDRFFIFFIDNAGNIWLGKDGSLYKANLNDKTNQIKFQHFPITGNKKLSKLNCMMQDNRGNYWLGTDVGLFYRKKVDNAFSEIKTNNGLRNIKTDIYGISEDRKNNNIWINTIDTVYIYNIHSDRIEIANVENLKPAISPLSNGKLGFHDNTGCHWIDLGLSRVYKFRHINDQFKHIKVNLESKKPQDVNPVFSIFQDSEGVFWFSSRKGVIAFNEKRNSIEKFLQDSESLSTEANYNYYGIGSDIKGDIWVGSNYGGLYKFNKHKKEFKNYLFYPKNSPLKYSNNIIRTIFTDSKGRTWFARLYGVSLLKKNGEEFINYELIKVPDPSFDEFHFFDIVEDDKKNIWIAGSDRLFKIRKNIDSIEEFIINKIEGNIYGLHYNKKSEKIYLGCSSNGLLEFDVNKKRITKTYKEKDGLPSNTIYCFLEDKHNNLWISTGKGISKFNPSTGKFINFDQRHGVDFKDCSTGAEFINSEGEMFFGGDFVVRFHPDSIKQIDELKHFPIILTSIKSLGKEKYFDKPLAELKQIELTFSDSYIEMFFSCLDYRFPDSRQYKYKLEGFDKDWINADKRNFASYANLKVGTYLFRIQSTNADGIWNPKEFNVKLIIRAENITQEPLFSLSLWVLTIAGAILLIVYALNRKQRKKEEKLLKEKESLISKVQLAGLQALRSQMNPHFLYNVLNSVNSFISKNERNTANKFLVDFGKLMRYILDNSGKHIHSIEEELEFLKLYLEFEHLRFADIFDYEIVIDPKIKLNKTMIPTMIVQPLIENSIRHGLRPKKTGGRLILSIFSQDEKLKLSVIDNGIGFGKSADLKKEYDHRSTGIQNINERLEILKNIYRKNIDFEINDLTNKDLNISGTEVRIIIDNPEDWNIL